MAAFRLLLAFGSLIVTETLQFKHYNNKHTSLPSLPCATAIFALRYGSQAADMKAAHLFLLAYIASIFVLYTYLHKHGYHWETSTLYTQLAAHAEHEHRKEMHVDIPKIIHQTWKSKVYHHPSLLSSLVSFLLIFSFRFLPVSCVQCMRIEQTTWVGRLTGTIHVQYNLFLPLPACV